MAADILSLQDADVAGPPDAPQDSGPAEPDTAAAVEPSPAPDEMPEATPETDGDASWIERFLEENRHLALQRPALPPAPPRPIPDGDHADWPVPEEYGARDPRGGYRMMRLLSRMTADLAEATQGKRAATYAEVAQSLGDTLVAEGIAPRGYTAEEAAKWWHMGGSAALRAAPDDGADPSSDQAGHGVVLAGATDPLGVSAPGAGGISAEQLRAQFGGQPPAKANAGLPGAAGGLRAQGPKPSGQGGKPTAAAANAERAKARAAAAAVAAAAAEAKRTLRARRLAGLASSDPYSTDNLTLGVNDLYADYIKKAARESGQPVQMLAALISAEAAKINGVWDPKSKNRRWSAKKKKMVGSSACGLTQFLSSTWIGEAQRRGSYLNGVAQGLGYLDKRGVVLPEHKKELLDLRFDPQHSISASADYAVFNLNILRRNGLIRDNSPAAIARYAYLMHHEGPTVGRRFIRGDFSVSNKSWNENIPKSRSAALVAENGNDRSKAYRNFMIKYTDQNINVRNYMIDADGIEVPATSTLVAPFVEKETRKPASQPAAAGSPAPKPVAPPARASTGNLPATTPPRSPILAGVMKDIAGTGPERAPTPSRTGLTGQRAPAQAAPIAPAGTSARALSAAPARKAQPPASTDGGGRPPARTVPTVPAGTSARALSAAPARKMPLPASTDGGGRPPARAVPTAPAGAPARAAPAAPARKAVASVATDGQRGLPAPTSPARPARSPAAPARAVAPGVAADGGGATLSRAWPVPIPATGLHLPRDGEKDSRGFRYSDGRFAPHGGFRGIRKKKWGKGFEQTPHLGDDVPGAIGTAVRAAADGVVVEVRTQHKRVWAWDRKTKEFLLRKNRKTGKMERYMVETAAIDGWGNFIRVRHPDGYITRYGHLRELPALRVGTRVTLGQQIGVLGNTGNARGTGSHVHFEVQDAQENHYDPADWINGRLPARRR
ncbi:MAG: peptidoglycan DD-metalloendopeptidase family protein [Pseudomonadota bacterium]